jgi:hypothetical protein
MNDQPINNTETPKPKSWREERWERREARRAALGSPTRGGALIVGLLLVILGVAFLLNDSGIFSISLKNWGALFILLPAFGAFDRAYRFYRSSGGRLTAAARGAAFFGLLLLVVTVVVLFDLNWQVWGPVLIIVVGISFLLNSILGTENE